jgi:uncharacterized membrane protein
MLTSALRAELTRVSAGINRHTMRPLAWVSLLATVVLVALFPLVFGELMVAALAKLHLNREAAVAVVLAIVFGSVVNIPVKRIVQTEDVYAHPLAVFGLTDWWPALQRVRRETVIAVNVGGGLVPAALALYELGHLVAADPHAWIAVGAAVLVNTLVCYLLARPVPRLGIVMPGLIPPVVAALVASTVAPEWATPVAFIAGVAGPLIGADLLHLKHIAKIGTGIASIGGAGTFDGIVLSGIVAAYLS